MMRMQRFAGARVRHERGSAVWVAVGLAVLAATASIAMRPAAAQDSAVIYRCTDAKGAVTVQNGTPCAKGMKQQVRYVGAVPTAAPPPRAEAPPAAETPPLSDFELVMGPQTEPLPASAIPDAERKPPPALFQCSTWDEKTTLLEHGEPEPECVPLDTIGIGGNTGIGQGVACEMRRAECTPLAAEALCTAWKRHVGEAQFRAKFASADDAETRKLESDRRAQLFADSNCPR